MRHIISTYLTTALFKSHGQYRTNMNNEILYQRCWTFLYSGPSEKPVGGIPTNLNLGLKSCAQLINNHPVKSLCCNIAQLSNCMELDVRPAIADRFQSRHSKLPLREKQVVPSSHSARNFTLTCTHSLPFNSHASTHTRTRLLHGRHAHSLSRRERPYLVRVLHNTERQRVLKIQRTESTV